MMKKDLGPVSVMGFARYAKRDGVATEQLIEACLAWRHQFLDHQDGIAMHCFLGNLNGQFADAMLAVDYAAFERTSKRHPEAESSQAFMELLEPDSLRLAASEILKSDFEVPKDFSCVEFGTFRPRTDNGFSEAAMLRASRRIETDYLSRFSEPRAHFLGRTDENTYSEIAFVETLGAARRICNGYNGDDSCRALLAMFDPASVDLDFWHVLA